MWKKIPAILKNKYFITLIAFLVWITFFDRNNLISRYELGKTIQKQQKEKEYYLKEIEKDSLALHNLLSDTNNLIRFGREKFLMKKDSEVIFLVVPEQLQ